MSDKQTKADEIIEKLAELNECIMREARQDHYRRDFGEIERLLVEQRSLERRLKRLDEE